MSNPPTLIESSDTLYTNIKDWNILKSCVFPMGDPGQDQIYHGISYLFAKTEDGFLAIFDQRRPTNQLVLAAKWSPPMMLRGPSYNQLLVDRIFSQANFLALAAFIEEADLATNYTADLERRLTQSRKAVLAARKDNSLLTERNTEIMDLNAIQKAKYEKEIKTLKTALGVVKIEHADDWFEIDL